MKSVYNSVDKGFAVVKCIKQKQPNRKCTFKEAVLTNFAIFTQLITCVGVSF